MTVLAAPPAEQPVGLPRPLASLPRQAAGRRGAGERVLAEETAVAITYDKAAYAVMMATPADLEDFAVGFSLAEGVVEQPDEIRELEIIGRDLHGEAGIELRLWLREDAAARHTDRRRRLAGPVGCGLCGLESLDEAMRPARRVTADLEISADAVVAAMRELPHLQWLNQEAHAVHAAAFWRPGDGIVLLREDVGRHNALDKLAGAAARSVVPGSGGAVLLTSRVSVEMVQKTARLGAPVLVAVSAPTALAVRTAEACGVTLVAVVRDDGFEVFTHPGRVSQR